MSHEKFNSWITRSQYHSLMTNIYSFNNAKSRLDNFIKHKIEDYADTETMTMDLKVKIM